MDSVDQVAVDSDALPDRIASAAIGCPGGVFVEIKHSDWDKMMPQGVRRNVKRQARQIWRTIELQPTLDGICPGIVFPKRPSDPKRLELIEHLFEEEGIPVVWEDEPTAERKAR